MNMFQADNSSQPRITIKVLSVVALSLSLFTMAKAQNVDPDKLANNEREKQAACVSDVLNVAHKHGLGSWLSIILEAACAFEIERVKQAIEQQLTNEFKEEVVRKSIAGQVAYRMLWKADELYRERRTEPCVASACRLPEYRECLVGQIPAAIRGQVKPRDFERAIQEACEQREGNARSALLEDFGTVLRRYTARGVNHAVNDAIRNVVLSTRQAAVVLYAEDLVKVQPGRKSCRPEMCGVSPCISLSVRPTEYECVINQ